MSSDGANKLPLNAARSAASDASTSATGDSKLRQQKARQADRATANLRTQVQDQSAATTERRLARAQQASSAQAARATQQALQQRTLALQVAQRKFNNAFNTDVFQHVPTGSSEEARAQQNFWKMPTVSTGELARAQQQNRMAARNPPQPAAQAKPVPAPKSAPSKEAAPDTQAQSRRWHSHRSSESKGRTSEAKEQRQGGRLSAWFKGLRR
jgi:hypothetical protein